MYCEKCGKQINDEAAFCPYCGYTMDEVENPLSEEKTNLDRISGKETNPDWISIVSIILLSVQIISFIYQGFFVEINEGTKLNVFYVNGLPLLFVDIILIFGILKNSNVLYRIAAIAGIPLSGSFPLLLLGFFILLLLKINKKKIANMVLYVFAIAGWIFGIWMAWAGEIRHANYAYTSYGAYYIGAVAGAIAYILLVMIIDRKYKRS